MKLPENQPIFTFKKVSWLLLVSLILIAAVAFKAKEILPSAKASIRIVEVTSEDFNVFVKVYGKLKAKTRVGVIALTEGNITEILKRPGAGLSQGDAILKLSNPKLDREYQGAQLSLLETQAEFAKLEAELAQAHAQQLANIKLAEAQLKLAGIDLKANTQLRKNQVISALKLQEIQTKFENAEIALALEKDKLDTELKTQELTLKAAQYRLKREVSNNEMLLKDIENLVIRTGIDGVLVSMEANLEVGQQISSGAYLGTVVDENSLYAELFVSASEAEKVQLGQMVSVNIRGKSVDGKITRISPTVVNGTVDIDVDFDQLAPQGAMPNLDVNGQITIASFTDALVVERPVYLSKEASSIPVFVYNASQQQFERKIIEIQQTSMEKLVIKSGLQFGDQILVAVPEEKLSSDKIKRNDLNE